MADFGALKPRFKNAYEDRGMVLTPISDAIQDDQNLEPQMVRIRAQNNGCLFLDAKGRGPADTNFNLILDSKARKIKRWAFEALTLCWVTPNVNQRNNLVTFFSTNSAANHTVRVVEGFYLTPLALMTALVAALNTATGASGLTFTWIPDPVNDLAGTISSAGGDFHFISDANVLPDISGLTPIPCGQEPLQSTKYYMDRGRYLWNLPVTTFDSTIKRVGPICLAYTRFIDIESFTLNQYTKNPNVASDDGSTGIVARLYINDPAPFTSTERAANMRWCNYDRSQAITGIDFRVLDEYNEKLYIPCYASEDGVTTDPFDWIMELLTEV